MKRPLATLACAAFALVCGAQNGAGPADNAPKTVLDSDHQFDGGSQIALTELSATRIENLATLGKVWGFLKYHHPRVVRGELHWDYELFRILPAVLAAPDRPAANAEMAKWIDSLGASDECRRCAQLSPTELALRPDLAWIDDETQLGAALSAALRTVYRNRPSSGKQFYVALAPGIGNPQFQHEPDYAGVKLPDSGFQLLALYRFWNMVEYWYPYRDVIGEDWNRVLPEFIPRIALARTPEDYQLGMMALIARVHDTHANLWSAIKLRPPVGQCSLPAIVRFVENRAVVAGFPDGAPDIGLKPGDVIETLDGVPAAQLVERWRPYYGASNEAAALRDLAASLTHGPCEEAKLGVRRGGEALEIGAKRQPMPKGSFRFHDLPGDTFRRLTDEVAYLKLSSAKGLDAAHYIDQASGTKGLILDLRNYPSEFMVFRLGSLLVDKETPFATFTSGDLSNPGAFHFGRPVSLIPAKPHYGGQIVILVDEVTQSQAEYTSMAFRAAPKAYVIGSTTAGADGNVSPIPLPGGLKSMISGLGVFYPDKRPTQRVGILPDLEVKPTIAGLRAGRDEVLEAALRRILGPGVPEARIEKLAQGGQQ